jgi:hypothetical protein
MRVDEGKSYFVIDIPFRGRGTDKLVLPPTPPALMTLCIDVGEAYHEENDGKELLERRVPMGPK